MINTLRDLLTDEKTIGHFVSGLPEAFEMVAAELPSNPAIGLLREQVIVGFLMAKLGSDKVKVADSNTQRDYDLLIDSLPLSLKTITGQGGLKILWTVDQVRVAKELKSYQPKSDLLLIRIFWGSRVKSVFYIPITAQQETRAHLGQDYLHVGTGTNHRGIEISKKAINRLESHAATIALEVEWRKQGLGFKPYERWEAFWRGKTTNKFKS